MKNKVNFIITPILIRKLIGAIAVTILLICMILKSSDVKLKLFILPFFVCGIFETGKIICLLMDKKKWSNIFGKLFTISFLVFWFGFLSIWCYLNIKDKNYMMAALSIPFWAAGIYIIRRRLVKRKKEDYDKRSS